MLHGRVVVLSVAGGSYQRAECLSVMAGSLVALACPVVDSTELFCASILEVRPR